MKSIKVIGFDADDTLWSNASYFKEAEACFLEELSVFHSREKLEAELYRTETDNMKWYGYGVMAFTLSMVETALRVSEGKVSASAIDRIVRAGRAILEKPIELFPGVPDIFPALKDRYQLVVVTQGDLLDQQRKLKNSGLMPFFHHVEVVARKSESSYRRLVDALSIRPSEFLMVGNSLKSDISPVLSMGGRAIHVPCAAEWQFDAVENRPASLVQIDSLLDLPGLLA
jgi:putative hydrolase of the HAD superfamily